jgi:hypothetical protein
MRLAATSNFSVADLCPTRTNLNQRRSRSCGAALRARQVGQALPLEWPLDSPPDIGERCHSLAARDRFGPFEGLASDSKNRLNLFRQSRLPKAHDLLRGSRVCWDAFRRQ